MATGGMISQRTSDIIKKLKESYGGQYPYPEFWDYVLTAVIANPPLGEPHYQTTYVTNLFKDWANKVNTGAIKLWETQPSQPQPVSPPTQEPTAPITEKPYVLTDDSGQKWVPQYDDVGKISGWSPYNETSKAQLDLAERKWATEDFATRQQQVIDTERNRQAQIANQWQRYSTQLASRGNQEDNTGQMAKTYEDWRQRLMGELTDSRDWITKWQVQNQPNPYKPQVSDTDSLKLTVDSADKEVKNAEASLTDWTKRTADNTEMVDPAVLAAAAARYNNAVEQRNKWQSQLDASISPEAAPQPTGLGGNMSIGGAYSAPAKPKGIPIPSWLPTFVPQLAGKKELTPADKYQTVPSGQMWQATPTSVKQGLAGYMDWVGQDYRDTLDYMSMMLPNDPTRIPTAWSPRR